MNTLVAYYRVSTRKQEETRLGLDAQRKAVHSYAHTTGQMVVAEFEEVESGKDDDRPILAEAMKRAKCTHSTLVIAKLDRLSRSVAFLSRLMESGVQFICCDNPHATNLTLHILAALAQYEREMTSKRTKEALAALKARGVKLGTPNHAFFTDEHRERARARAAEVKRRKFEEYYRPVYDRLVELGRVKDSHALSVLAQEGFLSREGKPLYPALLTKMRARWGKLKHPKTSQSQPPQERILEDSTESLSAPLDSAV